MSIKKINKRLEIFAITYKIHPIANHAVIVGTIFPEQNNGGKKWPSVVAQNAEVEMPANSASSAGSICVGSATAYTSLETTDKSCERERDE